MAKTGPKSGFGARLDAARRLAKERRWKEAGVEFDAALKLEPGNALALFQSGVALFESDRAKEGLERMLSALERAPKVLEGWLVVADLLLALGRDDTAEKVILAANFHIPKRREFLERLATVHERRLRLADARVALRALAAIAPRDASVARRLGLLELAAGDPKRAEASAKRAESLAPKDAEMPFALAVIYEAAKVFEPAKAAYRRALGLDPGHWRAMTNLGRLLATDRKPALAEAQKLLARARTLAPKEPAPALDLALALEAKGDAKKAAEAAKAVLAMPAATLAERAQAERLAARAAKKKA
jgi:Flp pilus assembly protein TadD